MGLGFKQWLVGEKHCMTTSITAVKEANPFVKVSLVKQEYMYIFSIHGSTFSTGKVLGHSIFINWYFSI